MYNFLSWLDWYHGDISWLSQWHPSLFRCSGFTRCLSHGKSVTLLRISRPLAKVSLQFRMWFPEPSTLSTSLNGLTLVYGIKWICVVFSIIWDAAGDWKSLPSGRILFPTNWNDVILEDLAWSCCIHGLIRMLIINSDCRLWVYSHCGKGLC